MKKVENVMFGILFLITVLLLVGTVSSCSSSRSGCYDTRGLVGYK